MIAQTRPDIANVTEQTVLALRDLEGRISVLKGGLATLCQGLGHPQAAQLAAAPTPPATFAYGNPSGQIGSPWAAATPFGLTGSPYASYASPFGSPWPVLAPDVPASPSGPFAGSFPGPFASPFPGASTGSPFTGNAYATPWTSPPGLGPYGNVHPATAAWLAGAYASFAPWPGPFASHAPLGAYGNLPATPSPFANVPAGYR